MLVTSGSLDKWVGSILRASIGETRLGLLLGSTILLNCGFGSSLTRKGLDRVATRGGLIDYRSRERQL